MSHFSVAVLHRKDQNVDEMLAPFDENLVVDKYIRYTKEEAIDYVKKYYGDAEGKTDEECYEMIAQDYRKEGLVDDDGNIYSTYNPLSKWDWYQCGGRFSGMLKIRKKKSGKRGYEYADEARLGDIDFTPDKDAYQSALRFWDVFVDKDPPLPGEEKFFSIYKPEYYKDTYGTREEYAKRITSFSTFAVLTSDGKWCEKGEMGWFGMSSDGPVEGKNWDDNYMDNFVHSQDKDLIMTIVDCHI
jgi:hypothetical protein